MNTEDQVKTYIDTQLGCDYTYIGKTKTSTKTLFLVRHRWSGQLYAFLGPEELKAVSHLLPSDYVPKNCPQFFPRYFSPQPPS